MSTDIPLTSIESSMLDGHGYDPESKTMAIRFKGGKTYHYTDVPQEVYQGLISADSAGKFFGQSIRGKFGHRPIDA